MRDITGWELSRLLESQLKWQTIFQWQINNVIYNVIQMTECALMAVSALYIYTMLHEWMGCMVICQTSTMIVKKEIQSGVDLIWLTRCKLARKRCPIATGWHSWENGTDGSQTLQVRGVLRPCYRLHVDHLRTFVCILFITSALNVLDTLTFT